MDSRSQGFTAITSVLIISAVVLVVSISVSLLAIGEGQSGYSTYRGEDAYFLAEGCMEDALLKSKQNASYTGGTLTRPEGSCTVSIAKVGSVWTITTSSSGTYTKNIQAVVQRNGSNLTLSSWKEL
jgi:uncharacterized protein (UPF0333 family)